MSIRRARVPRDVVPGALAVPDGPAVAHVLAHYLPAGQNWIYEQVRRITRYRSFFAAKRLVDPAAFPWDPIYSLDRCAPMYRLWERSIRRATGRSPFFGDVLEAEGARLVHAHGGGIATLVLPVARVLGLPLVASFYGVDMWMHREGDCGLERKYHDLLAHGVRFVAEGPAAAAQLVRIGCPADRIVVQRLGVDPSRIPFLPRRAERGCALRVLMAARFVEKKGLPFGVEAFSRVARDHPDLRLTIVGGGTSRRNRRIEADMRSIVERHGVEHAVRVVPFLPQDQLLALAEQHHVLLQPSVRACDGDSEGGHPVTLPLLAASRMPIMGTRHCDIPEIVQDGVTGWLCAERDVDALEAALRAIVQDPSPLPEMGRRARALVECRYDIRKSSLDTVYDAVVEAAVVR